MDPVRGPVRSAWEAHSVKSPLMTPLAFELLFRRCLDICQINNTAQRGGAPFRRVVVLRTLCNALGEPPIPQETGADGGMALPQDDPLDDHVRASAPRQAILAR